MPATLRAAPASGAAAALARLRARRGAAAPGAAGLSAAPRPRRMRGPAAAATAGGPPDPDTPALTHVVAGAQICPHSAVCNPRACVADADWDRLQLVDRELELAVREEQYAAAAALELYSDAILLDPTWAGAHVGRGCLLYRLGGYEAAVADLETAVTLDPYQWLALQMLALARGQLRRWDEARAALALAASGCPGLAAMQDFRAVEATLARWEAEAAAWRARFEAARDIAMATEGRRQLEAAMLAPPAPDWEARGSS